MKTTWRVQLRRPHGSSRLAFVDEEQQQNAQAPSIRLHCALALGGITIGAALLLCGGSLVVISLGLPSPPYPPDDAGPAVYDETQSKEQSSTPEYETP